MELVQWERVLMPSMSTPTLIQDTHLKLNRILPMEKRFSISSARDMAVMSLRGSIFAKMAAITPRLKFIYSNLGPGSLTQINYMRVNLTAKLCSLSSGLR